MRKKNTRILVVEDERIVALDLQNLLGILGYDVVAAVASGEEATHKAEQLRPDLVLMDINLNGKMDGIQAAEFIRGLKIPVIFLTACCDESTLERAKVTEPFSYILKPFDERELHGHIEIALYKNAMENRLRESEERYSLASQGANDGLWDWNVITNEVYYSPRWKSMLGYQEDQIGRNPEEWLGRVHPDDRQRVEAKIREHLSGVRPHFEDEYRILHASGAYRWMLSRGLALRDSEGQTYRMAGSQTDITDRKVYDPQTGLPNRALLMDRMERALERARRQPQYAFAVLALNTNAFGFINDSLGQQAVDRILSDIARRLQMCVGPADTIAQVGQDQFVLLLEDTGDPSAAMHVGARIREELARPVRFGDQEVVASPAVGIAMSLPVRGSAEEILRDALTALHRAATGPKAQIEIFDETMRYQAVARLKLESDLRRAIENHQLDVHYQPIVRLRDGRIAGFEALVRWQRDKQLALPKDFIPVAEATDLIIPLERWVLHRSCLQLTEWQSKLGSAQELTLSVNLSAKQYTCPDFVDELKRTLESTGLNPRNLRLEITETTLMENTSTVFETLAQIKNLQVDVHMDDFGTGYSSLSYLHRFPISALKVDRAFVTELCTKPETRKIVQSIVALGRNLGLDVIAEGIEMPDQLKQLRAFDCDYGQGYLFSRPMSSSVAETMLRQDCPWLRLFVPETNQFARMRSVGAL